MITLNVNIDHVATVRNARGGSEPEPVTAALKAELAGASGIVCHLREDRRHVNDQDLKLLRESVTVKLDLEMAANEEIIKIALKTLPDMVTIVPEKRQELTTEGGLDVAGNIQKHTELVRRMHEKNIFVSFFVEPDEKQIEAVLKTGGDMVELHTGVYANAIDEKAVNTELKRIINAVEYAHKNNLKIAAGHGLNYFNTKPIAQMPQIDELSIGHSIISRSIYVGIETAVKEMIEIINTSSLHGSIK
ncbi:pyridoxine 5'-phosphate synthase [Bacteroidota bacterium]